MAKINQIASMLAQTDDEKLIKSFLESLLTPAEIKDISSRWELVLLLNDGMSQRNIAHKLRLSLCKITRGSKELKKRNSPFKKMIERFYAGKQ